MEDYTLHFHTAGVSLAFWRNLPTRLGSF